MRFVTFIAGSSRLLRFWLSVSPQMELRENAGNPPPPQPPHWIASITDVIISHWNLNQTINIWQLSCSKKKRCLQNRACLNMHTSRGGSSSGCDCTGCLQNPTPRLKHRRLETPLFTWMLLNLVLRGPGVSTGSLSAGVPCSHGGEVTEQTQHAGLINDCTHGQSIAQLQRHSSKHTNSRRLSSEAVLMWGDDKTFVWRCFSP